MYYIMQYLTGSMTSGRKVLAEHKPIAVSYSIASIDPHWRREVKTYTGVDCVQWFLEEMQQVSKEIRSIYKKSMPMKKLTEEEELRHLLATKCFLCERHLQECDEAAKKQADHCQITGQYRGPACKYCNLKNFSLKAIPIPIVFHNFSGYDSKLIMQHVRGGSRQKSDRCKTCLLWVWWVWLGVALVYMQ